MEDNFDFQLLPMKSPKISKHQNDSNNEMKVPSHVIAATEDKFDFQLLPMRSPKISKQQKDSDNEMEVSSHVITAMEDLLTEILVRLPVKSLLCFKSVSKEWLSLITSPPLCDLKGKRSSNEISGILVKRECKEVRSGPDYEFIPVGENYKQDVTQSQTRISSPMKNLNFICADKKLEVLQYCNGLLLCRDPIDYVNTVVNLVSKYYVFNPSTKNYTAHSLNRVLDSGEIYPVDDVNLAFDPRKSPHYKLICTYRFDEVDHSLKKYVYQPDRLEFGIYSSETGLLKQTGVQFRSDHGYSRCELTRGIYWNGAVNWIDYKVDGLYFHVDEERLGTLPMPPVDESWDYFECDESGRWIRYFGESNDHLHLIVMEIAGAQFDVYEMDRGYSGWSVRFHVDLQPVLDAYPEPEEYYDWDNLDFIPDPMWDVDYYLFGVLAVVEKDDDESFLVLSVPGKAVRFNLKDNSFTSLCDLDEKYGCKDSIQFIESLSRVQF